MNFRVLCLPILILTAVLLGQSNLPQFEAHREDSNPSSGDSFILQQPAAGTKRATIIGAVISCSAACEFYLACGGSTASQTAVTPVETSLQGSTATLKVWRSANVTGATQCSKVFKAAADSEFPLDTSGIYMLPTGTVQQIGIVLNGSVSGTVRRQWVWRESR